MDFKIYDELPPELKAGPSEVAPQNQVSQESLLGGLVRGAGRTIARGAEAVAGIPGDLYSTLLSAANKVTGGAVPSYEQMQKVFPEALVPTSKRLQEEVTKPLTRGYLEPRTSGEETWDQVAGDAATLLFPLKGPKTISSIGKSIAGALGKSAVGNFAQWATEKVTGSPLLGAAAKIGGIALAGTYGGRKQLEGIAQSLYDASKKNIPEGATISLLPEKKKIETIWKNISKGDHPDKAYLLDRLSSFKSKFDKQGSASVKDLLDLKQDWNAQLRDPGFSKLQKGSKKLFGDWIEDLAGSLEKYGQKNPKFYKPLKEADEVWAALKGNSAVNNFLNDHPKIQSAVSSKLGKAALGLSGLGGAGGAYGVSKIIGPLATAGIGAGVGATALGIHAAAKAAKLLYQSPVARKYYADLVKDSLKNAPLAAMRSAEKFNKAAEDFEKKNPGILQEIGGEIIPIGEKLPKDFGGTNYKIYDSLPS